MNISGHQLKKWKKPFVDQILVGQPGDNEMIARGVVFNRKQAQDGFTTATHYLDAAPFCMLCVADGICEWVDTYDAALAFFDQYGYQKD